MRYSVTGTRELHSSKQRAIIRRVIRKINDATEFSTGGADGVDSYAAFLANANFDGALLRGVFPEGEYYDKENHTVVDEVEMVPGGYMARNDRLVHHADVLLAFPKERKEVLRSGTWATIRRARKAGVKVLIYPIN